ncbi:pentapeptide repeat-containing protein [Chitinophaga oryzae]|uniref:Pentapeptide repeat-containing protein n=1 Tax=Chitinophaga oryzae TaxID=2725414 RepID=A0ABX6LEV8_9BACT|nr:pentapeptide repeat-containing protein [Chitinophaga oryzae]QJB38638.1 pentapeptide repeat-containing protein [Chitinophaga oryzae]
MDTKIIGSKITRARKAKGLSQAGLAQQLFISPQAVGKWERGESMPDITTFYRLAEMLEVDLNYFSENGTAEIPATSPVKQPAAEILPSEERQVPLRLTAVDMQQENFAGATLHKGKFKAGSLQGANFEGADLTGSTFEVLDARGANFDGANLTDCSFSITDLTDASFHRSILVRTRLHIAGHGAIFTDVTFLDARLTKVDLQQTRFERCTFNGTDFHQCDMRGMHFDGQTFIGVKFDKSALKDASFSGATLRNVSFKLPFSLTNRSHLDFQTVCFDGATMDKITYAALKGLRVADLSKVTVV